MSEVDVPSLSSRQLLSGIVQEIRRFLGSTYVGCIVSVAKTVCLDGTGSGLGGSAKYFSVCYMVLRPGGYP